MKARYPQWLARWGVLSELLQLFCTSSGRLAELIPDVLLTIIHSDTVYRGFTIDFTSPDSIASSLGMGVYMRLHFFYRSRPVIVAGLLLAVGFVSATRLSAQGSTSATVLGTVTDSAGAVVPNAAVRVK